MRLMSLCQTCGNQGPHSLGEAHPSWCTCVPERGFVGGGPYVAAPGFIARLTFESKADAAFREQCRLAGKERFAARDALCERFVPCGRRKDGSTGYRELLRSSPKVRALEWRYRKALEAEEALQAICPHPWRSIFNRIFCDVCHMQVECDVEHFRHLVREVGKRAAMRLAV